MLLHRVLWKKNIVRALMIVVADINQARIDNSSTPF
jgi:hypothetical protein